MDTYHKIQTMWLRDPEMNHKTLIENAWAKPEFEYLADADWEMTEKVDGMNIRVIWDGESVEFRGKSDNAQMHPHLTKALEAQFPIDVLFSVLSGPVTLYGEGYGAGIQKGGGKYREDKGFILFDIKAGDFWLEREKVNDLGAALDCLVVPVVYTGPLRAAIDMCRYGYASFLGTPTPEGVVCRPLVELTNRYGERVITKLKRKDFPHASTH